LLTSKEIIERTGISRATLNNYIASGLVPRPQVLPPGPEHGAAPRIGYFPDDTIARVEEIQRLKREGMSIARIAEHLAAHPPGQQPAAAAAAPAATPAPAAAPFAARPTTLSAALTQMGAQVAHPAYLVNEAFRIVWANDQARSDVLSPLAQRSGIEGSNALSQLLAVEEARGREALLRFHLQVAQARGAIPGLFRELPTTEASRLQRLLDEAQAGEPGLVMQASVPAGGGVPARSVYAVQFREGVLFAYAPQQASEAALSAATGARIAPAVTPVAVLVSTLQDASGLWVKLTAQEYFELLNEVWAELDRIFRRNRGRTGAQGGEVLVCYFLPQSDSSYLWNALAAAHQTRDAMRQVSHRWQVRKGWDVELSMNVGVDEGQEWMGVVGEARGEGALRGGGGGGGFLFCPPPPPPPRSSFLASAAWAPSWSPAVSWASCPRKTASASRSVFPASKARVQTRRFSSRLPGLPTWPRPTRCRPALPTSRSRSSWI
jgi:adenylate cyclase